jgi:hypothetical protein
MGKTLYQVQLLISRKAPAIPWHTAFPKKPFDHFKTEPGITYQLLLLQLRQKFLENFRRQLYAYPPSTAIYSFIVRNWIFV